jgi:hypothetical protein
VRDMATRKTAAVLGPDWLLTRNKTMQTGTFFPGRLGGVFERQENTLAVPVSVGQSPGYSVLKQSNPAKRWAVATVLKAMVSRESEAVRFEHRLGLPVRPLENSGETSQESALFLLRDNMVPSPAITEAWGPSDVRRLKTAIVRILNGEDAEDVAMAFVQQTASVVK